MITKNFVKYLSLALVMLLVITQIPLISLASSFSEFSLEDFIEKIQTSDIYKEYYDEIDSLMNKKEVDGEGIHRKTVQYKLKSDDNIEKTLTFVADEKLEYQFIGTIEITDSHLKVNDILNNTSQLSRIDALYNNCETFRCTKERYEVDPDKDLYCSFALGELCNYFSPLFTPVEWLLCQAGVIVGCKVFALNKVCVEGRWYPVCEY